MQKNEIQIGDVYTAKVTNKLVQVRIDAANRHGGWDATNLTTNKKVRIRTAAKLRSAVDANGAMTGGKKTRATKQAKSATEADTAQTSPPASELAATAATACPNCGETERDDDGDCAKCHEPVGKMPKRARAPKEPKEKRMSGLDAAAKVLSESEVPMNAKEMIEAAEAKGYWKSPGGKTPQATIYSAIIREISTKGPESRFRKTERGRFVHA